MKRIAFAALAAILLWPVCAWSAENWTVYKDDQSGAIALAGMPDISESDRDLWLMCRKDGRISVGAGANDNIGGGNGEAVSMVLTSAGKSAALKGTSRNSENFPMTGGTELTATVSKDDPLFAVLATGQPIKMKSAGKTGTWSAKGLQKALAKFRAACPAKK